MDFECGQKANKTGELGLNPRRHLSINHRSSPRFCRGFPDFDRLYFSGGGILATFFQEEEDEAVDRIGGISGRANAGWL